MAQLPGYGMTAASLSTQGVIAAVTDLDRRLADAKTELTKDQRRILMTWLGTLWRIEKQ